METIYEMMIKKILSGNEQQSANKRSKLKKEIKEESTKRLENLQDLLVDGKINPVAYSEAHLRYNSKREELKKCLNEIQSTNSQYKVWLSKGVHLLKDLKEHYKKSSIDQKQKLLSSIFPENLFFEENKCRTERINDVLRFILQIDKGLDNKKRGQISNKLKLSSRVESPRLPLVFSNMSRPANTTFCLFKTSVFKQQSPVK